MSATAVFSSGFSPSSTPNPTPTSTVTNDSGSSGNGTQDGVGTNASVYYAAVALAVIVLMAVTIASRIFHIRRNRTRIAASHYAMSDRRRGGVRASHGLETHRPETGSEEPGLPSYRETTSAYTVSYVAAPVGSPSAIRSADSRPVPPDHPLYAGPTVPVGAYTRDQGDLERGIAPLPPGYARATGAEPEPPKYDA